MKHLCVCVAVLAMGTMLIVHVGCNVEIDAGDERKSTLRINMSKEQQLEEDLRDPEFLPAMREQLAKTKQKRSELTKMVGDFYVESEVTRRHIERITKASEEITQRAGKLRAIIERDNLMPEDKTQVITIGTQNFTGEDIYRMLEKYGVDLERAKSAITRAESLSKTYQTAVESIRSHLSGIEDAIAKTEETILNLEVYTKILAVNDTLKGILEISVTELDEILNTGAILSQVQTALDRTEIQLKTTGEDNKMRELNRELGNLALSLSDDGL